MTKTKNEYVIPVKKGDIGLIISDPRAHFEVLEYAIDFLLPEGTEVLAARDGEVSGVHVDSDEGGIGEKYMKDPFGFVNWITIDHENGEFSQYFHLKHEGSCVKVGDKVRVGEVVGYSGNTGFSTAPHLHFQVCIENDSEVGWETLEVLFKESFRVVRNMEDLTEEDKMFLKEVEVTVR